MELHPNAENASEAELLAAMEAAPNKRSYIRLAAVRALLHGLPRQQVCLLYHRSDRMVRLWITNFNSGGIDALASKPRTGRPRKVLRERLQEVVVPVLEDPAAAGERHWTGVKLHGWLKKELTVEVGYRTVIRYLHELNYNLRVPQPWPERQDEAEREAFLEKLRGWQQEPELELWFCDECGVEGDPRRRRQWTARGQKARVPYLGDHIRANVIGALCPATGESFAMIFDGVDTDVFACFLEHLNKTIALKAGKRRKLIVDNASWHKSQRLDWGEFEREFLPGYSPDFNPIERLWLRMKADFFSGFIAHTPDELTDQLSTALNHFMDNPQITASQCAFRK